MAPLKVQQTTVSFRLFRGVPDTLRRLIVGSLEGVKGAPLLLGLLIRMLFSVL